SRYAAPTYWRRRRGDESAIWEGRDGISPRENLRSSCACYPQSSALGQPAMLAGANALGRRVKVSDAQQPGFPFDHERRIRPADGVRRVRVGLLGRHAALLEQVVRAVVQ